MSTQKRDFDILSEASVVNLLMLIREKKEIMTVDVKAISGNDYRLKGVLEELKDIGLIEVHLIEKPYLTYNYKLTEKGNKVAEKLAEIESIMKGNHD